MRSLWLKIVTAEQIVKMIKQLFEISKTIQNSISVCAYYVFVGLLVQNHLGTWKKGLDESLIPIQTWL